MMNLFEGHQQWRSRPKDERYWNLDDLHAATLERRQASVASTIDLSRLNWAVVPETNDVALQSENGTQIIPSHWAFGQLAGLLDAPARWLRAIPADLAKQNLDYAVQNAPREQMHMLWSQTHNLARCFTSMDYSRLWDEEFVSIIQRLTGGGWKRPPAITDDKYPSGLYAGDRNVFMFLVNEDIQFSDGEDTLFRGFFAWNSEVRQMSWGLAAFLYKGSAATTSSGERMICSRFAASTWERILARKLCADWTAFCRSIFRLRRWSRSYWTKRGNNSSPMGREILRSAQKTLSLTSPLEGSISNRPRRRRSCRRWNRRTKIQR